MFNVLNKFVLYDVWWRKNYLGILDNLYIEQKIISWFSGRQYFQLLSFLLIISLSSIML
jgi:hypothetical protein